MRAYDRAFVTRHDFLTRKNSAQCAMVVPAEEDAHSYQILKHSRTKAKGWTLTEAASLCRFLQRIHEIERENTEMSTLQFSLESNCTKKAQAISKRSIIRIRTEPKSDDPEKISTFKRTITKRSPWTSIFSYEHQETGSLRCRYTNTDAHNAMRLSNISR